MRAYILKESESELRVSASPDSVKKMVELGISVNIQTAAGQNSNFSGLLTTPNVTSGGRTGYVSDSEPLVVSPAINITNGGDYGGGGSLTIAVGTFFHVHCNVKVWIICPSNKKV